MITWKKAKTLYGPNIDDRAASKACFWADQVGVDLAPRLEACSHRIRTGACRVRHCSRDEQPGLTGWADHPSMWRTPDGQRLFLAQPYGDAHANGLAAAEWAGPRGLHVAWGSPVYYGDCSVLISADSTLLWKAVGPLDTLGGVL